MLKTSPVLLFLFFLLSTSYAQQTQYFIDKEQGYRKGLELFDEKNYLSAREKFEEIYKQCKGVQDHGNEVMMQNLEYYIAVCATETNDKDAETLLLDYSKHYHETDKRRHLYFYLGKYYYNNKNYQEAINYFAKVKVEDLDNNQIYDYKFQAGYSYFTKKKFVEAKPFFLAIKAIKDKYYYPSNYYYAYICFYNKDYDEALKGFTEIEDSKMYASVIPYYIAQIYFNKKDYDKLIPYLTKNIAEDGVMYKDEMKFMLGQTYFQKNEYAKALPLIDEYITKTKKRQKDYVYQLAYCQYKTGVYDEAIENFKQLNLLNEKLGQNATYALGDCYLNTGQKDKARSAFQSAASMSYDETITQNSLYNYGKLSFELGYSSDAIKSFETYRDKYPTGTYIDDVNELLATTLVQTKDYDRAYKMMDKIKLNSPMIKEAYQKVTYFRAVELYNDHKEDEALELCNKSLSTVVNIELQSLASYLKAEILYSRENYDEAATLYMNFAQSAGTTLDKKGGASKFRALYNLAYCYFKKKNYADAQIYFTNAAEESDETVDIKGKQTLQPDLYLRWGDCAFIGKNYQKAIKAYTFIADNQWTGADYAQFQKGIILGLQGKDNDKVDAMNYLLSKFPGSNYADQAYFEIGETELNNSNFSTARTAYQAIINKFPGSTLLADCYLKLAVIDYNSGKKQLAVDDYKSVVQKFPKSKQEKEALAALKDLYVELGRADEYFDFVKNSSNITISSSEQDSLTYLSAENAYKTGDCARAITLFTGYLEKFPGGYFANEVHWEKSECHLKVRDFPSALTDLNALIQNKYSKYYERALVKASGISFYEVKNYQKAFEYYSQLYVTSTSQNNTYSAMLGMFRTAVKLNQPDEVIEYADQLINSGTAKELDIQEAYYEKGKAYYGKSNTSGALAAYNRVTEYPVSERCVEAKYMVAKIMFEQANYKQSLDTCFKIKTRYASYEYWVVKTFILMADNYYAQGNSFQAKSTLESIVRNYEGDAALLNEAKQKLEKIRTEELNKTKLMQVAPIDTFIMESDTLIRTK